VNETPDGAEPRVFAGHAGPIKPQEIPYAAELQRKALHLLALVVPFGISLLGKSISLLILIPAALLALAADYFRARSEAFARVVGIIFGSMMRRDEVPTVGGPVSINGATWVLVSAALLAFVFPIRIAVPAFVMFMVCDAAAALVGRKWGRIHWGRSRRTVEGSLAFLVTGLTIMAFFPSIPFWIAAISVICAAIAEAAPRPFNDNIRVPFVAALVIILLEWAVLGRSADLFLI
jgi:dolichol kinase